MNFEHKKFKFGISSHGGRFLFLFSENDRPKKATTKTESKNFKGRDKRSGRNDCE